MLQKYDKSEILQKDFIFMTSHLLNAFIHRDLRGFHLKIKFIWPFL